MRRPSDEVAAGVVSASTDCPRIPETCDALIPGKKYRPEDLPRLLWRRRSLIAVSVVAIGAATALFTPLLPNVYKSETLILVVPQRVPESYVQATVTTPIEGRLQSISQQILSRPRLERIINDFNLYARQRKTAVMEEVVQRMRREIDVQVVKGDAFRVSYVSDEPRTAMHVVERLASLFIEENLRDREVLAEGTNQFLEAQLENSRRSLVDHEKKLAEYRLRHADEMPGHLEANLQGQHNAELQVQALVNALGVDRDRRRTVERQVAELAAPPSREVIPSTGARPGLSQAPVTAAEELAIARDRLAALELAFTAEHPDVARARRAVVQLERKAAEEAALVAQSGVRPVTAAESARADRLTELRGDLEDLNREIAAKEDQEKRLRATIATYQQHAQATPIRESELAELTRDYDTITQMYRSLLQRNEASKIAANLERRQQGEQFKVLEPANYPEKPSSPNRPLLNLLGAVCGFMVGLCLTALIEYLDTTMRTESDVVAALSMPVLGLVPDMVFEDEPRERRAQRILGAR